jgi:outer membrane protein TolC
LGLEINDPIGVIPFYDYEKVMAKAWDDSKQENNKVGLFTHNPIEFQKPLDEYVQMAYDHRPDLKMEANRLRANIMAKRASVGKLLPQLNMVMEFGELAESFTDNIDDPAHHMEWQAIVEFSWNLAGNTVKYNFDRDENAPSVSQFQSTQGSSNDKNSFSMALLDNLEDVYKVKEAQVDVLDQFVKLEEKEREVIKQVKESYFNFRRAEIQLASAMKQLLYREKLSKLQKHKLEQNEIQSSEYLQSEIELVEEKTKFHKAMSDYYVARASLNRAVGIKSLLPIEKWGEEKR